MDIGKTPVNLFLHFFKAFDTLVYSVLLHKIEHYGIDGLAYKIIESCLENRKQYVEFMPPFRIRIRIRVFIQHNICNFNKQFK